MIVHPAWCVVATCPVDVDHPERQHRSAEVSIRARAGGYSPVEVLLALVQGNLDRRTFIGLTLDYDDAEDPVDVPLDVRQAETVAAEMLQLVARAAS